MKILRQYLLVYVAIVLMAAAACLGAHKKTQKVPVQTSEKELPPPGACAPNISACGGNAELCMEQEKNAVCE